MMKDPGAHGDPPVEPSPDLKGGPGQAGAVVIHAATPDDTKGAGALLARFLRPGDTVLLGGELGAGKTTLTQGLARALGVGEPVTSPTFVLVHSYQTAAGWELLHADVWRLQHLHEVIDLALPELLEDGAAAVIEWGEIAAPALAPDWLHVAITYGPGPENGAAAGDEHANSVAAPADGRRLEFRAFGPSWQSRLPELSAAWAAPPRPAATCTPEIFADEIASASTPTDRPR